MVCVCVCVFMTKVYCAFTFKNYLLLKMKV